jgi:DNA ligase-1
LIYLPWLYYKDSKGHLRCWTVGYEDGFYCTYYGSVHGIITESEKTFCNPTNLGRSNVRDEKEQAKFEAEALWKNKKERRYRETPEEAGQELFLPMLANKYEGKRVAFPVFVQPKLDGVRCLAYWDGDSVALMSRAGKPYDVPHIAEALQSWLPRDVILDGELYCHGLSCQSTTSLVRGDHDQSPLEYWVYDLATPDVDFYERNRRRENLWGEFEIPECIAFVETLVAQNQEAVDFFNQCNLQNGYEGSIVRTFAGLYKFGRRSGDLLKYKQFQDDEFEVVDYKQGEGKQSDCCIFQCKAENGKTFWCMPKGTIEEREAYLVAAETFIGKKLTVKYFDRTEDGLPRFPVGLGFKEDR